MKTSNTVHINRKKNFFLIEKLGGGTHWIENMSFLITMKSTVSKNQPNSAEYLYMERPGMIKQSVLLKSFYKFNSIPVKILRGFFFRNPTNLFKK